MKYENIYIFPRIRARFMYLLYELVNKEPILGEDYLENSNDPDIFHTIFIRSENEMTVNSN